MRYFLLINHPSIVDIRLINTYLIMFFAGEQKPYSWINVSKFSGCMYKFCNAVIGSHKPKITYYDILLINIKRVSIKGGTVLYTCREITDLKQSEEALKEQCIFCKIIKGDIPSRKVYEDEYAMGILDINRKC